MTQSIYKALDHKSSTIVGDKFCFLYNKMTKCRTYVEKCSDRMGVVVKFNADTFTLDMGEDKAPRVRYRQFRWIDVVGAGEKTGIMVL